jgi:hypothetical protein
LHIGAVTVGDLDVASYDLSPIESILGAKITLIIGQDILRYCALELQFDRDRARIGQPSQLARPNGFVNLKIEGEGPDFPSIPISLEGTPGVDAILDLGSSAIVTMSDSFAAANGFLDNRPVSTTMTVGAGGPEIGRIFCLKEAKLGSFIMRRVPVCVVRNWILLRPVHIGWPFLSSFDVDLDLGGRTLWLKTNAKGMAAEFPKDRSGIGGARRADRIVVRHVALNSPAEAAGLHAGDEIIGIDGRRIDASYPPPGERQGARPAGTKIELQLADGRTVNFILADYF